MLSVNNYILQMERYTKDLCQQASGVPLYGVKGHVHIFFLNLFHTN